METGPPRVGTLRIAPEAQEGHPAAAGRDHHRLCAFGAGQRACLVPVQLPDVDLPRAAAAADEDESATVRRPREGGARPSRSEGARPTQGPPVHLLGRAHVEERAHERGRRRGRGGGGPARRGPRRRHSPRPPPPRPGPASQRAAASAGGGDGAGPAWGDPPQLVGQVVGGLPAVDGRLREAARRGDRARGAERRACETAAARARGSRRPAGRGAAANARARRHLVQDAPSAQRSARASAGLPSSCSGAMYCSVPTMVPAPVSGAAPSASRSSCRRVPRAVAQRARPKSSSFAPAFVSMMLPGLRSRWTMPVPVGRGQRFGDLARRARAPARAAAGPA